MRQLKLIGLLLAVIVVNIIVLSPGFLGVDLTSDSPLEKSAALTLLILSGILVIYASYRFVFKQPDNKILLRETEAVEQDAQQALVQYRQHKLFSMEVQHALDQLHRMKQKKLALLDLLSQRFQPSELSYSRFLGVISAVEQLFNNNIKGLISKLRGSELSGLSTVDQRMQRMLSPRVTQQKQQLRKEYTDYVLGYISSNEEILIKLDQLMLETTRLGTTDYRELDDMPCMQEIDQLIKQTKYYKQ